MKVHVWPVGVQKCRSIQFGKQNIGGRRHPSAGLSRLQAIGGRGVDQYAYP